MLLRIFLCLSVCFCSLAPQARGAAKTGDHEATAAAGSVNIAQTRTFEPAPLVTLLEKAVALNKKLADKTGTSKGWLLPAGDRLPFMEASLEFFAQFQQIEKQKGRAAYFVNLEIPVIWQHSLLDYLEQAKGNLDEREHDCLEKLKSEMQYAFEQRTCSLVQYQAAYYRALRMFGPLKQTEAELLKFFINSNFMEKLIEFVDELHDKKLFGDAYKAFEKEYLERRLPGKESPFPSVVMVPNVTFFSFFELALLGIASPVSLMAAPVVLPENAAAHAGQIGTHIGLSLHDILHSLLDQVIKVDKSTSQKMTEKELAGQAKMKHFADEMYGVTEAILARAGQLADTNPQEAVTLLSNFLVPLFNLSHEFMPGFLHGLMEDAEDEFEKQMETLVESGKRKIAAYKLFKADDAMRNIQGWMGRLVAPIAKHTAVQRPLVIIQKATGAAETAGSFETTVFEMDQMTGESMKEKEAELMAPYKGKEKPTKTPVEVLSAAEGKKGLSLTREDLVQMLGVMVPDEVRTNSISLLEDGNDVFLWSRESEGFVTKFAVSLVGHGKNMESQEVFIYSTAKYRQYSADFTNAIRQESFRELTRINLPLKYNSEGEIPSPEELAGYWAQALDLWKKIVLEHALRPKDTAIAVVAAKIDQDEEEDTSK